MSLCESFVELNTELPADLVTLEAVKTYAGISTTDTDAELNNLIKVASQLVEKYCNRIFSDRVVTETIIVDESYTTLILDRAPVKVITGVTLDGVAQSDTYHLNKSAATVRKTDGTAFGAGTYVFTYTAGPDELQAPVAEAVKELVRNIFDARDRAVGVAREAVPDVADVTYSDIWTEECNGVHVPGTVAAMLSPYVLRYS